MFASHSKKLRVSQEKLRACTSSGLIEVVSEMRMVLTCIKAVLLFQEMEMTTVKRHILGVGVKCAKYKSAKK